MTSISGVMDLTIVDMGTKLGRSITEFRKRGHTFFGDDARGIPPERCLGIDKKTQYMSDVQGQGYRFLGMDVTSTGALENLPEADFYLAWDFLEHLPDKKWSGAVVWAMIHKARKGVWIKMPSFEPDEATGEGALRKLGLRFAWTHWHGHPSHYLVQDCVEAIQGYKQGTGRNSLAVKVRPGRRVRDTLDKQVVPIDAPIDTVEYKPSLGSRTVHKFDPPLVAQWDVIVTV